MSFSGAWQLVAYMLDCWHGINYQERGALNTSAAESCTLRLYAAVVSFSLAWVGALSNRHMAVARLLDIDKQGQLCLLFASVDQGCWLVLCCVWCVCTCRVLLQGVWWII